ncbi:hypothetical protein Tco_0529675 [Tanacetum coccineum]
MEEELYNLSVKGNDLKPYVRRFQELTTLCPNMVINNEKLLEAFIGGLPQSIEGNVTASKPQTLEEATNIAQRLMDQILKHNSVQEANDRKRKRLHCQVSNLQQSGSSDQKLQRQKIKPLKTTLEDIQVYQNLLQSENPDHQASILIGISAMVIENKVKTLTITTFHFLAIKVLRATTFRNKTMSSPNHSTSDIEDSFSSMNILNYTSVSSDYFPASSGSSSFNSSENSTDNIIPPIFSSFYKNPYLKDVQAFYAKESPISSPDPITSPAILTPSPVLPPSLLFDPRYFFVPEELLPPKKRIHSPSSSSTTLFNSFQELSFHHIEKIEEGRINGNELKTELKEIRTQIIKLQKKRLGKKDKIAFAHYRISDLERIIEKIQAHHQTNQEDL